MTIGIIGLGYVGLTLAVAAADCGIKVYGVEVNPHIKKCLSKNQAHFFEPGLDALIAKHNNKQFMCVEWFPSNVAFDAFIITVGTPLIADTKQPNFGYIKSALACIQSVYTGEQLVVLRSTVSVGTTRNVILPFLAQLCDKPEEQVYISMCPERTVEGKAIEELRNLPQIISGNNGQSLSIARKLFSHLTSHIVAVDSLEEAELAKLYCNVYRDMTFALGNVLCMTAQQFGVDGTKVICAANEGYERTRIPLPGFVAGPCLEKDAYILTNNMPEGGCREFILSARGFNESLENIVVNWVERTLGPGAADKVVALSGMAFKGVPETSDLRGSSSVYIAQKLYDKGYTLRLHDFVAHPDEIAALGLGQLCHSVEEACNEAGILLVLNNHPCYRELRPVETMKKPGFNVLDAWNVCRTLQTSEEVRVQTLGTVNLEGA